MKKLVLFIALTIFVSSDAKSSHVYGGDMHFEQIGANKFILFFRLTHDSIGIIDSTSVGIYENNSNLCIKSKTLTKDSTRKWILKNGSVKIDSIYVSFFSDTLSLANKPNGYYSSWSECCRISYLKNISSGSHTLTCQIPNPALPSRNSNPEFVRYPDSFCVC